MMPSLSDRKEIAKRLRLCALDASCCADIGAYLPHWVGVDRMKDDDNGMSVVTAKEKTASSTLKKLADLIDHPTCEYLPCAHAIWYDDDGEEHEDTKLEALGTSEDACCSSCGYEMVTGDDGWFDYERKEHGNRLIPLFDYCPNCGARVVIEDE